MENINKYSHFFKNAKHIHFTGIGGVSMSALAMIAKSQGKKVSGSDMNESASVLALRDAGIEANDIMTIVDKFNEVGNNYAISSKGVIFCSLRSKVRRPLHSSSTSLTCVYTAAQRPLEMRGKTCSL